MKTAVISTVNSRKNTAVPRQPTGLAGNEAGKTESEKSLANQKKFGYDKEKKRYNDLKKGWHTVIRIALVEDDLQYRTQLKEYIAQYAAASGQEIHVTEFSDGDEIALHYKAEYDIILMDIEMTFMDGMTAAEEIRQKDQDVVIIFITNSPQYAIKGYAVDALDYVLKPVSYFAFSQRLERAIKRMKRREEKYFTLTTRDGTHRIA